MPTRWSEHSIAVLCPVDACNLACCYCNMPSQSNPGLGSNEVEALVTLIALEFQPQRPLLIYFHGGEPTLAGHEPFRTAAIVGHRMLRSIQFHVQSNLTELDDAVIEALSDGGYTVSTSLDGPASCHNAARIYPNGEGSFDQVLAGIRRLRDADVEVVGATVTIGRHNADHIAETYGLFAKLDLGLHIGPIIPCGGRARQAAELALSPRRYLTAVTELFDLWFNDSEASRVSIPAFELLVRAIVDPPPSDVRYRRGLRCASRYVAVNSKGHILPCFGLSAIEPFASSDMEGASISECLAMWQDLLADACAHRRERCVDCEAFTWCEAGCVQSSWARSGSLSCKDWLCAFYKGLYVHARGCIVAECEAAERADGFSESLTTALDRGGPPL